LIGVIGIVIAVIGYFEELRPVVILFRIGQFVGICLIGFMIFDIMYAGSPELYSWVSDVTTVGATVLVILGRNP